MFNPMQLKALMKNLKTKQINAKRVVFELEDKKLIIENPQIIEMEFANQKTYQIIGNAKEESNISEEDIKLLSKKANVSLEEAKKALEETNGDLAEALLKLTKT